MNKKLKIFLLVIQLLGVGISLYFKIFLLTVALVLILTFNLYIFFKWKKIKMKNNFILRTFVCSDIILFCFFILMFRMIQIQLFDSKNYKEAIKSQTNIVKNEGGERGNIYDNKGKGLAYSINMYELSVDPKRFVESEKGDEALKELINKKYIKGNYRALLKNINRLGEQKRRYKRLNRNIDDVEKKEVEEILEKYGIKGKNIIFLEMRKERRYYKSDIYFFLVGNIGFKNGTEKEGVFGIEYLYENYLKGEKTSKIISGIRSLGVGLPASEARTKVNLNGMDLHLTIDNDLQYILNDEVEKQYKKTNAEEAYAIMMDPTTGKILATSFFRKNKKNVANPIFQSQIEPGSVFKPLVIAAALNEKKISKNTNFDIGNGTIKKYNHTIRESSRKVKGILSTEDVLKKSSNVGMVLIGDRFTNEEFDNVLTSFGLYEKTDVDYPYEKTARHILPKNWHGLKKSTMSFGQGIAITPLQMITAFSAVINGGILYQPYLVEKITDRDGLVIRRNLPIEKRRVINPNVSKQMREMMELAVLEGTVVKAQVEGYRVGGKTGTAQYSENGRYVKNEYLASVVGFFPVEKPQYTVMVVFFKPQGDAWYDKSGGTAAAPVLGEIVKRVTKLKNIYSQSIENIKVQGKKQSFRNLENQEEVLIMPDLKGMSAREVIEIFKGSNIELEILGVGVVQEQFPEPKKEILDTKKIKIKLN
ncbi:penicillin-binding transpeptidase domain-containing protein [uncultured Cetobacterium sp.]|uniref:penicillin-binding transpeptidase domain-containing protein n=1 Tax=uncultured Cetobacterium sp. TaxID=527638 RepID=UPI002628E9EF|nr:penicillin-binding transpeptidase domain-containing protein [uncultured Cetobacterium sp.]